MFRAVTFVVIGCLLASCNPPSNSRKKDKKLTRSDQSAEAAANKLEALRGIGGKAAEEKGEPPLPPSLKESLGVRTFKIPAEIRDSEKAYQIALIVGEDSKVTLLETESPRDFLTLVPGATSSELVYSFHSEQEGQKGAFELSGEANWEFHHPDPKMEEGVALLASGTIGDSPARLIIQPVAEE